MKKANAELMWRIWSNEHRRWWNPNGCGYTPDRYAAGLYTLGEATKICKSANMGCNSFQEPNETMLPVES